MAGEVQALGRSVKAADALATVADAIGDATVGASSRVTVGANSRSPQDGLALLSAYVEIEDQAIRQAILDLVVALSGRAR